MKRRKFLDLILKGSAGIAVAGSSTLLTGCSDNPYINENLLAQYKTIKPNEPIPTFIMCPPDDLRVNMYTRKLQERSWKALKQAIEGLGGNVITLDASRDAGYGEVWTRDPALIFPEQKLFIIDSTPNERKSAYWRNLPEETKQISEVLEEEGFQKIDIQKPLAHGGDVIIDEDRRIVFLGSSDLENESTKNTIQAIQEHTGYTVFPIHRQLREDKANYLASQSSGGTVSSAFYHLDTGMAKLPKGGYLISESITDEETLQNLKALLGNDLIVVEDKLEVGFWKNKVRDTTYNLTPTEDAKYKLSQNTSRMAYNLISVGNTLIMPYCSEALMSTLQDRGYKVVTPEVLNLEGIKWEFGNGSIHCATNQISQATEHDLDGPVYGITPLQEGKRRSVFQRSSDSVMGLS